MSAKFQHHKPECTDQVCYCLDDFLGDPMCDCGNPAWCCRCYDLPPYPDLDLCYDLEEA